MSVSMKLSIYAALRCYAFQRREFVRVTQQYPARCRTTDFPGFYGLRTIKHYSVLPNTVRCKSVAIRINLLQFSQA